jgi:PST family polysaccharide transporter
MQLDKLQSIVHNIGWLSFDKVLKMGVGLIVGVWVARYLGLEQYAFWNHATAFEGLFGASTTLGLDSIVVSNLAKDPEQRDELLGSAFYMKLWAGVTTVILAITRDILLNKEINVRSIWNP